MTVWWEGRTWEPGALPLASDRSLLLGDGLFETVLVRAGAPVRLTQHLDRLERSAGRFGIPLPDDLAAVVGEACQGLLARADPSPAACLRITLTRGSGRGLDAAPDEPPNLLVSLTPFDPTPPAAARLATVDRPRIDPTDPLSGHKTTSALRWVHARRLARAAGADVALLRTLEGDICEADAANVFAVLPGGQVVTPSLDRGVLPGITRDWCLSGLRSADRPVREERVEPSVLGGAAEIFLTSSLSGPRAVASLDGRPLPETGEVTRWLADCWKAQ